MKRQYDVIIVGCGVAGCFTALHLPKDRDILMITKSDLEESDSFLAQGGICVLKNDEDYDSFYEDTMRAGHYENRPESVDIMIRSSREVINELIQFGVDFASRIFRFTLCINYGKISASTEIFLFLWLTNLYIYIR